VWLVWQRLALRRTHVQGDHEKDEEEAMSSATSKVDKLLTLAERSSFPEECDAATTAAYHLSASQELPPLLFGRLWGATMLQLKHNLSKAGVRIP